MQPPSSVVDPDPGSVPGCLGSGSISYSNEHNKILTGRENLTNYAFWFGLDGPTDKENQVKMYKKYCLGTLLFETVRIRIRIKKSDPDPYQIEKQKQDPDLNRYQSEKQDLDPYPYQKGLDPQHCHQDSIKLIYYNLNGTAKKIYK